MTVFQRPDRQATRPSGKHLGQDPSIIHAMNGSLFDKRGQTSHIQAIPPQRVQAGTVLHGRLHERSPEFGPHDAVLVVCNAWRPSELCLACEYIQWEVATIVALTNGPDLPLHEIFKIEPIAPLRHGYFPIPLLADEWLILVFAVHQMDQSLATTAFLDPLKTSFEIRQVLELWIVTLIAPTFAIPASFGRQQNFECFFEVEDASRNVLGLFQSPFAVSGRDVDVGTACDVW